MKQGLLGMMIAAGCGAAVVPESAETTTSTSSTGPAATTAMLDSTAPPDPSTSSAEADSTSTGGYELPKLDVAGPDVGTVITCSSTGAQIVDLTVVTPSGPFAATHAWWAWEQCCINDPWLLLAAAPEVEVDGAMIVTPHVMVHVPGTWESSEPFVGMLDVRLRDIDRGFTDPIAGLEIAEPLDPELPVDPEQRFVATFAVESGGWSIGGSIDAPYCVAIENPPCPCE